jgi:hypothetical protein
MTNFKISNILNIFKDICNYETINNFSKVKLRNKINGISLNTAFLYRFLSCKKFETRNHVVSILNHDNKTAFTRQGYDSKEENIPVEVYESMFRNIATYYINISSNALSNTPSYIAVDGTYNNDYKHNEVMNLGLYDMFNDIPIDISSFGIDGKNQEIKSATAYISGHIDDFKNAIFVGDRGYFSYNFLEFLDDNDLKFIVRVRGDGDNLIKKNPLKRGIKNYDTIKYLRKRVRVIKHTYDGTKTILAGKGRKSLKQITIRKKSEYVLVTNIRYFKKFPNQLIVDKYNLRWNIETYFKYIKDHFKFQNTREKNTTDDVKKNYLCIMIITYLERIIERYYSQRLNITSKNGYVSKINKSLLTKGIFDLLLAEIFNGTLTSHKLVTFCKCYIKIVTNKTGRSFPRISKTPFSKWYIKAYAEFTKYHKILQAILDDDVESLNKNLKTIAKKITFDHG